MTTDHKAPLIPINLAVERARFIEALQDEVDLLWNPVSETFASVVTQKMWETWQRAASIPRQHWERFPESPPAQPGHYDAWDPDQGRIPDAYYEDGQWSDGCEGVSLPHITHYTVHFTAPDDGEPLHDRAESA